MFHDINKSIYKQSGDYSDVRIFHLLSDQYNITLFNKTKDYFKQNISGLCLYHLEAIYQQRKILMKFAIRCICHTAAINHGEL